MSLTAMEYEVQNTLTKNPMGPAYACDRIIRGESWGITAQSVRSAYRHDDPNEDADNDLGLRRARVL